MLADPLIQTTLPEGSDWRPPEPDDPQGRTVLAVLQSDDRTYSRAELVQRTGLHDRAVRQCIEALRLHGWPICSSSGQAGYRLSFDPADLIRLERDLASRAVAAFRLRRAIRAIRERRAA
jgi:biotin operon repressor